ncbi:MAG: hypothetical protein AMS27_16875, partial [Bacteroides sp. SM23_62_1]
ERQTMEEYIHEKAIPQVTEILSNYGDIAIMWWDTPVGMTESLAEELHKLLELQPEIIENNRLYRPWKGDFSTPEQYIPPTGLDYDWEVCMTMNTSWGYKYYDDQWKSTETLIRYLVDITSKGGNFLLNVGPTALGEIPQPSIDRLKEIGKWMDINGESVYGTTASPFFKLIWGVCTKKVQDKETILYLHVFNWPENQVLEVPGLMSKVSSAEILTSGEKLKTKNTESGVSIHLPSGAPDAINSVIKLKIKDELSVISNMPRQSEDGSVFLPVSMSDINNPGYGEQAFLSDQSYDSYLTNWVDSRTRLQWMFHIDNPGTFEIIAELALNEGQNSCIVSIDGLETDIIIEPTGSPDDFKQVRLGEISYEKTGELIFTLRPAGEIWNPMKLKTIILQKIN